MNPAAKKERKNIFRNVCKNMRERNTKNQELLVLFTEPRFKITTSSMTHL